MDIVVKRVAKCIGFCLILVLVLSLVYSAVEWKDTSKDYISVAEQLRNTDKNMVEVAFVGSSHVYRGIYPSLLWKNYGISSFNLSVSEQDRTCSYDLLKQFLTKQSPKVVCVEMFGLMYDSHNNVGDLYRNIYSVDSIKSKYERLNNEFGKKEALGYLTGWPVFHTRYKELKQYDFYINPQNGYLRGEIVEDGIEKGKIDDSVVNETGMVELDAENKAWIDSLYELSKEYGFELVFFMTPYSQSYSERLIENGAKEYAKELGIPYIDFSLLLEELDFVPEKDMGDVWHCNIDGATKVTDYFGKFLKNEYDLNDFSKDEKYYQWEKDYEFYSHNLILKELKNHSGRPDITDILINSENLVSVISLEGDFYECIPFMEGFNVPETEYADGGKWLIKDGTVTKIMGNVPGESHVINLSRFDSFLVQCDESGSFLINVLFNKEGINYYGNGINIIVYDTFSNKLLGNLGMEKGNKNGN